MNDTGIRMVFLDLLNKPMKHPPTRTLGVLMRTYGGLIPFFLPDHLVKNVPGTEWPAYKRWQGTEAFLSYLILPFPSHPGDQGKLLSVERGRCKEEISKSYRFTWNSWYSTPAALPGVSELVVTQGFYPAMRLTSWNKQEELSAETCAAYLLVHAGIYL